jgi:hypothetical protein
MMTMLRTLLALLALACAGPLRGQSITYADWIASYGLSGPSAEPTADPDADGWANLLEYAFEGLRPTVVDSASSQLATVPTYGWLRRTGQELGDWTWTQDASTRGTGLGGVWHAGIRWTPRSGVTGIRYRPEISYDLTRWYSGRGAVRNEALPGGAVQSVALARNNAYPRYFMRVAVEVAPEVVQPVGGVALSGLSAQALDLGPPVQVARATGPGAASSLQLADLQVERVSSAPSITDYRWDWSPRPTNLSPVALARSSSDPSVIVPDPVDPYLWRGVAPGTATLKLATASSVYTFEVTVSTSSSSTVDVVNDFVPGSLRAHLVSQIDPLLVGKNRASSLALFTTQNHATAQYVRNPSVWAAPYVQQLTAISPWNSAGGTTQAGVLVSPRHILFATHYQPAVGATIRFVGADGTVVDRVLVARQSQANYEQFYPDITVGLLSSDVPPSISFARVLPAGYEAKLPGLDTIPALRVPTLGLDQEEKALVSDLYLITATAESNGALVRHVQPSSPLRAEFFEEKVGGDSGNPSFFIINGQLVLTTVWTYGGGGTGTSINYHRAEINAIMTALGGGYQLTPIDLSGFPSY